MHVRHAVATPTAFLFILALFPGVTLTLTFSSKVRRRTRVEGAKTEGRRRWDGGEGTGSAEQYPRGQFFYVDLDSAVKAKDRPTNWTPRDDAEPINTDVSVADDESPRTGPWGQEYGRVLVKAGRKTPRTDEASRSITWPKNVRTSSEDSLKAGYSLQSKSWYRNQHEAGTGNALPTATSSTSNRGRYLRDVVRGKHMNGVELHRSHTQPGRHHGGVVKGKPELHRSHTQPGPSRKKRKRRQWMRRRRNKRRKERRRRDRRRRRSRRRVSGGHGGDGEDGSFLSPEVGEEDGSFLSLEVGEGDGSFLSKEVGEGDGSFLSPEVRKGDGNFLTPEVGEGDGNFLSPEAGEGDGSLLSSTRRRKTSRRSKASYDDSEDGVTGQGTTLCDSARLRCTVRTGCQVALHNFFLGCGELLAGRETVCTTACQHALLSLLATEDDAGLAFINCHCDGDSTCRQRKRRVQVCQSQVLGSLDLVHDSQAAVGCGLARGLCEADTSCQVALRYYGRHCSQLVVGGRCTARCRNSVDILYRQPNAHKLRSCRCQGDEPYDCPALVVNTEKLCFQRYRHHQHPNSHHNGNQRQRPPQHQSQREDHRHRHRHHRHHGHRNDSEERGPGSGRSDVTGGGSYSVGGEGDETQGGGGYYGVDGKGERQFRKPGRRRITSDAQRHSSASRASSPLVSGFSPLVLLSLTTSVFSVVCCRL